jgi:aryl-alcohol dehydrogenase-like predicted oxidoreductase
MYDYTRDGVLRSVEVSLERLGLKRIDLLHINDPDNHYCIALDEACATLAELRHARIIDAIGVGVNQWQMLVDFARNTAVDCFLLAGRYMLLEQTALDTFLPPCQERNISVLLGGILNSGILATERELGSDETAKQELPPSVEHRNHQRLNQRAENPHQPRQQHDRMKAASQSLVMRNTSSSVHPPPSG